MERKHEQVDLIDLGAASTETQGPNDVQLEFNVIGRPLGISDDE